MALGAFCLERRTALVTGGARGLGFACARALLGHDARVIIISRKQQAAEEAAGHRSINTWGRGSG